MSRIVRIYPSPKSATQSARGNTRLWVLEFPPIGGREIDPLMGWTSSSDPEEQIRLTFPSREAAVAYAEQQALAFEVEPEAKVIYRPKAYGENFYTTRREGWTH
jgi:NADH dehydrogenase